jgi:hypothetical protein
MLEALFIGWAAQQQIMAQRTGMAADRASATAEKVQSRVELIQMDVDRLLMITEALWIMLRDEHGYTDEQLIQKVQEIDMRDGRLDGRVARQAAPLKCPKCGRVMPVNRPTCMFCGAVSTRDPFKS